MDFIDEYMIHHPTLTMLRMLMALLNVLTNNDLIMMLAVSVAQTRNALTPHSFRTHQPPSQP